MRARILAEQLGFERYSSGTMEGRVDGVWTAVVAPEFPWASISVRCPLVAGLPADGVVQWPRKANQGRWLGSEYGHLLIGCSDPVDMVLFLREEPLNRLLRDMPDNCRRLTIGDRAVHAVLKSDADADDVRAIVEIARAVQNALFVHWREFANQHQLLLEPGAGVITGTIGHIPIQVAFDPVRDTTSVRAHLLRDLPLGTALGHPALHVSNGHIADPILGSQVAAYTTDFDALNARVVRDEVRGPLLELIREYVGSVVWQERVYLVVRGAVLEDIERPVSLAVELAAALSSP